MSDSTRAQIERFLADFPKGSRDEDWPRYGDMFMHQFLSRSRT